MHTRYVGGPLATVASVAAAVAAEAAACGYELRLLRKWEYRMVTFLWRVSKKRRHGGDAAAAEGPPKNNSHE